MSDTSTVSPDQQPVPPVRISTKKGMAVALALLGVGLLVAAYQSVAPSDEALGERLVGAWRDSVMEPTTTVTTTFSADRKFQTEDSFGFVVASGTWEVTDGRLQTVLDRRSRNLSEIVAEDVLGADTPKPDKRETRIRFTGRRGEYPDTCEFLDSNGSVSRTLWRKSKVN